MNKEDKIKELFKEKLGNLETPVNPDLWSAIASQIGTVATTSTAAVGMSLISKLLIGVSAASIIGVGAYFLSKDQTATVQKQETHTEVEERFTNTTNQETSTPLTKEIQKDEKVALNNNKESVQTNAIDTKTTNPTESRVEVKQQALADLTDNKTFTNEPHPNLIGQKPAPIQTPATKKTEIKEVPEIAPTTNATPTVVEPTNENKAPSFELTNLPNIYVLNAHGYFSIGYKGEYTDFQFTLMDNASKVIFSSDQPDFEWRGTDKFNSSIQPGDYIYIITVKDKNGKFINKYNTLKVINQ